MPQVRIQPTTLDPPVATNLDYAVFRTSSARNAGAELGASLPLSLEGNDMNKRCVLPALVLLASAAVLAQTPPAAAPKQPASQMPYLKKTGAVTQMMVDGKPFIMLSGELHNSSASSTEYMKPIWKKLVALNLNTVIGTTSWELVEPVEGKFDFALVDDQIRDARRNNIRLVLIWFATWKNANSSYVPLWVKTDLKRFPRVQSKAGANRDGLTPLGEASLAADSRAFRALMRHIREVDPQHTVIMMQVENESGLTGDSRDRSALAEAVWNKPVPADLMDYLQKNKANLVSEVSDVWGRNGFKASGTWPEVFGTDAFADEVFMAWHVGRYIGKVAEAGKAELPIPMYANAWLVQSPGQLPGGYPSGGPVSRVMDIWKAAAPKIDVLSPDIYIPDFKGTCASFTRNGNPLFIPEARASLPNLFWAIGQHAALGYSPFGIENLAEDNPLSRAYGALRGMIPVLTKYQPEGKVIPVMEGTERTQSISFGGYKMAVSFGGGGRRGPTPPAPQGQPAAGRAGQPGAPQAQDPAGYGLIVNTAPDEFLFLGTGMSVGFSTDSSGPKFAGIGIIDEGRFDSGKWIQGRRINGDESSSGNRLSLRGLDTVMKVRLYRFD